MSLLVLRVLYLLFESPARADRVPLDELQDLVEASSV
jgi:hypothetical protein